jgi:tetratricopeptide (TPR) repeat protein
MNRHLFVLLAIALIGTYAVQAQDIRDISLASEYFNSGEYDKALPIYRELAKKNQNVPLIHQDYFKLLINTGRHDEAEDYIDKTIKTFPSNIYFRIDKGVLYAEMKAGQKEQQYFQQLMDEIAVDPMKVRVAAQHMVGNQLYEYAIETYKRSRKKTGDGYMYAIQMANIYRVLNRTGDMVDEYLNYAQENPNNIGSIKNVLQSVLREEEDLEALENLMYEKVQQNPNNAVYGDLLVWVNLQRKNFYAAFVQARALDKRQKLLGMRVMEIGQIAMENQDYKHAIRIFNYVIEQYPGSPNYQIARRLLIQAREEMVKNTYPVEEAEIKHLIDDYDRLVNEVGINNNTIEALRSKALLYAFYLHDYQEATNILNSIINSPRISKSVIDQSKIDLGDIYLLIGQPWESTLLYSQVEKSSKDTPIGYEAKLKNARLSYYKGDFELAKSHLDILKMATTREIANDAMALGILIKDNTMLDGDTTSAALKKFADIELLIFQNKKAEAQKSLSELRSSIPDHSLIDEILWTEANLHMELGQFQAALEKLQELTTGHGFDIIGDDAYFLTGRIYEEQLADKEKAMEVFQDFLKKYPGSNFAAEARKRFRTLRGDFL